LKKNKNKIIGFYRSLIVALTLPLSAIIVITMLYFLIMPFINHKAFSFDYIIIILALLKSYLIALVTFKNLSKLVKSCYSLKQLILIFGSIIFMTIFSFSIDYSCLYEFQESSFYGIPNYPSSYLEKIPDFFYFSVTTFATVGFGDIVPISGFAKALVVLEMVLSFLIIVFSLSNINKIHIYEE